jgi:hypothetical protein
VPIRQTTDPTTGAKIYTVTGNGGPFKAVGDAGAPPLELFLGNAGTAMRPLAAALCFGNGNFVLVRQAHLCSMTIRPRPKLAARSSHPHASSCHSLHFRSPLKLAARISLSIFFILGRRGAHAGAAHRRPRGRIAAARVRCDLRRKRLSARQDQRCARRQRWHRGHLGANLLAGIRASLSPCSARPTLVPTTMILLPL